MEKLNSALSVIFLSTSGSLGPNQQLALYNRRIN